MYWLQSIESVCQFMQVDLASVLVTESVHYSLYFTFWQVYSIAVHQSDQVKGVDVSFVCLVN